MLCGGASFAADEPIIVRFRDTASCWAAATADAAMVTASTRPASDRPLPQLPSAVISDSD